MKAKDIITATISGLIVFAITRALFGPDKYGLDRSSQQSQMLAEQDQGLGWY